ncbi:MAG TPA: hypothetical protein VF974_01850 [Patescibacteria group bacterium]
MNRYGFYIGLIIVSWIMPEAKGQQISQNFPEPAFDTWRRNYLQEKLFVHTDKDIYMPGEIAWFKIYYVDGCFHKPLQLSEIAYIELIDQSNKPVFQAKVSLKKSDGIGSILIPHELHTGYYKLLCYTQWMKNFDSNLFFEKLLGIISTEQNNQDSVSPVKEIYDLGFFPEGGNLVNGIESKIAFQVTNQYGKGMECGGVIVDGGKDTLFHFQTARMGMGHFKLTPVYGHEYLARLILANGKIIEKQLPSSFDSGITMQVSSDSYEKLGIYIHSNEQSTDSVYVFAHTRGAVKIAAIVPLVNGRGSILVDKNKLDEGITHFTVFKNNQPVCERLYFIFPRKQFQIAASADGAEYGIRKKIKIHIEASDNKGSPIGSKMSVSIYRLDSLQSPDQIDIQNYLLLTSDIKGNIESPSWYFNENEPGKEDAMDNLMLTHGWRRFNWKYILHQQNPTWKFAPEFNGEIVSARISDKPTGMPLENAPVFLSVPGMNTRFWSSVSDSDGIVNFELKNSFGDQEFIFQSPDSNAEIKFISPFSQKVYNYQMPPFSLAKGDVALVNRKSIYLQVQHVYNESKLNHFIVNEEDNTPFYQKPDVEYFLDRYTRFSTLEEVLREYVREINISNKRGSFHLHVNDARNHIPFEPDPLILLDGVAMLDINKFMNYDPLKIRSIGVVTKKYFLGNIGYYGIVDCKTYKGDMNGYALDPRCVIVDFDGLQQQREFYSPSYETPQKYSSRLPDFRTLLYWNPSLKTGNAGNEEIEFFSSDAAGRYVVVIQGISDQGNPAVTSLSFNVKK